MQLELLHPVMSGGGVAVVVVVVVTVEVVAGGSGVTVTVNDAGWAWLPAGSCALHVTVVTPIGNSPPVRL
jgi:hypothetical protein